MFRNVIKNKRFLLIAGLVIGLVTLFSHSLRVEIQNRQEKNQGAEQKSESKQDVVVVLPSYAVTVNFFTLHIDGFLEITPVFKSVKKALKVFPTFQKKTNSYFQTLFRFIISPNAP